MKSLLKKFPAFYRRLQGIYYRILFLIEKILGTRFQEFRWSIRHKIRKQWAQSYIDSLDHPHRKYVIEKILTYTPLKTVLEIGCNTGPNLYLLAKRFPEAQYYGIDINKNAIERGKKWLAQQGNSTINLSVGRFDNLKKLQTKSVDIVFTDATLIYIGPDKIRHVLAEMIRVTRKALILHEFHLFQKKSDDAHPYQYFDAHWIYNYHTLITSLLPSACLSITPVGQSWWDDKAWQQSGALIDLSL